MSSLVGALRAMLTLDSTQFVSGATKAQKSGKRLEGSLAAIGGTLRKVGLGLAIAGSALAVAIKGQLNAADEMGKAAQKFGVGVEELSRLKYAADLSDVSLETLGTSLRILSKNMVGALNGGKAQSKMFADIGVSVTDAAGQLRSSEAVMQDVADVLAKMPDGAEKTALAMQLFGKAGAEMIPMLNGGKAGLQEMAAEAQKFGVVITEETAKSAERFNDNMTRMKAALSGLVMKITAEMAPVLAKISDWAVEAANGFQSLDPIIRGQIYDAFILLGGSVAGAIELMGMLAENGYWALYYIGGAAQGAVELIQIAWGGLSTWFTEMWTTIRTGTEEAWAGIKSAIGGAITYVTGLWDTFMGKVTAAIETAKQAGQAIADALSTGKAEMNSGAGYGGMGGAMDEFGAGMFGAGQDGAAGLVEGFTSGIAQREPEISAIAQSVTNKVKRVWDINSPSRVFREIGQFLTEGLALGIKDNKPMVDQAMDDLGESIEGKSESFKSAFETLKSTAKSAFTGLVTGALSFKEALSQVIMKLAEMLAQSAFEGLMGAGGNGLFATILSAFGFAKGGVFAGGKVQAFANGGVVSGATAFAMQGGLGVMGEAGPEAIMPLARGKGGKLGVVAQGGGGGRLQLEIVENPMFAARVEGIADGRAVQVVRKYDREVVPLGRARNPRERG